MKTNPIEKNASAQSGQPSASVSGSTRRALMTWALASISTDELKRLKRAGENVAELVQRERQEKRGLGYKVERLEKEIESLREGNRRWREEAIPLGKFKADVEAALAKASNSELRQAAREASDCKLDAPAALPPANG